MKSDVIPTFAQGEALIELAQALQHAGYHFVTVSPASHQRVVARAEKTWAHSLRDIFGWSRPLREQEWNAEWLARIRAAGVLVEHDGGWRSAVRFSSLGEALYVHSAYPTEAADSVFFGPDTYRYVRAIEAHLAQSAAPVLRAVDIGCGAGPGAISIARRRPDAEVYALDINTAALRATEINALVNHTPNVVVRESNLLSAVTGQFDLIVANPPYLNDPGERTYRHGGGELGADVSLAILEAALPRLAPNGTLLLYTGVAIVDGADALSAHARQILEGKEFRWRYEEVDPDIFGEELETQAYAKAERIAAVVLAVTRMS